MEEGSVKALDGLSPLFVEEGAEAFANAPCFVNQIVPRTSAYFEVLSLDLLIFVLIVTGAEPFVSIST
jgi:hypothetical protein